MRAMKGFTVCCVYCKKSLDEMFEEMLAYADICVSQAVAEERNRIAKELLNLPRQQMVFRPKDDISKEMLHPETVLFEHVKSLAAQIVRGDGKSSPLELESR